MQNVVLPENFWIPKAASAVLAVMDSTSQTRVHSPVSCAALDKPHVQPNPHHAKNVATNAHPDSNWAQTVVASLAHVAPIDHRVYNQLVLPARSAEQHQRSAPPPWRNAHCQFVCQVPTLTERWTLASNVRRASTNPNLSKQHVSHAHRITARRQSRPPAELNAQIPAKPSARVKLIATRMLIASWSRRPLISSANVNQVSMVLEWRAQTFVIISVIMRAHALRTWRERRRVDAPARSLGHDAWNDLNLRMSPVASLPSSYSWSS